MQCPSCNAAVAEGLGECPSCGVIFAKWRGARPRMSFGSQPVPLPSRAPKPKQSGLRVGIIVLLAAIGAILAVAGYFGDRRPASDTGLERVASTNEQYDVIYKLPGSPQGIATNGRELVIGNRRDPWGAIRVRRSGSRLQAEAVPLIEPVYGQKMNIETLTWNGTNYVGYTTAAWFQQKEGYVFTIHDPKTMQILRHHPAPDIGCLAWDGTGYWASSRRNTRDADEPVFLYRLDTSFNIVSQSEPPAVGCQGLAWDGKYLWFVDVFDDGIFILDVSEGTPSVLKRAYSGLEYLSGVVFFEGQIWITEYGDNRLHRINPATRIAWIGDESGETLASAIATAPPPDEPKKLADRYENPFQRRESENTEVVEWSIELREDGLYGTWSFWFGADLFVEREQASSVITLPKFAKYTLTVHRPDGTEVEKKFDAVSGTNTMGNVKLDDAQAPGEYRVSIFLHVQYIDAEGTARILNNSGTSLEVQR